jgi:hypothetical protein
METFVAGPRIFAKKDFDGRQIDAEFNGKKCVYYCTSMNILNNHRRLLLHA